MKVLIVGINPSNRPTPRKLVKNSTFHRLLKWMDHVNVQHFSFINTFDTRKNDYSKSDIDYSSLKQVSNGYDKVVALGNFVSDALNKLNIKHFKAPHPSPRNRKFNDKSFEKQFLKEYKTYMEKI